MKNNKIISNLKRFLQPTAALIVCAVMLASCSKADLSRYSDNRPVLDLFGYFQDETIGHGMVQDRGGNLTRQFVVHIRGEIDQQNRLVLTEDFEWSDGEKSKRVWTIAGAEDGMLTGTAADVEGQAVGSVSGNVLNWRYFLNVEVDGRTWKIHLDDWMYLQPDEILINKTRMSKFGIHLGDITIVFNKKIQGDRS
jgi:hypothetical protein